MHDQPEPTEEELEETPERVPEEESKAAPGWEDPDEVEPEDRG